MEKEKQVHPQARHEFWKHHLECWQETDLTQAAYCRLHNLRSNRFTYWKKKIFRLTTATELVQIPEETIRVTMDNFFEPPQSPGLKICSPSGFSVEISENFSPDTLGRLLVVLKEI